MNPNTARHRIVLRTQAGKKYHDGINYCEKAILDGKRGNLIRHNPDELRNPQGNRNTVENGSGFVSPRVVSYPDRIGIHDLGSDSEVKNGPIPSNRKPGLNDDGRTPLDSQPSKAGSVEPDSRPGDCGRTDEELVALFAGGAREAFMDFYDRHSSRVFGWLVKLLGNQAEAEDVLQETFCQSWESAESYDPLRATPLAWLMMMARSRAYDHLRRRRRKEPAVGAELELPPRGMAEENESRELTRSALDQLPEDQRTAIGMAFYFGLSHQQIAERQEIPLGTVKTRIRRGMQTMRAFMLGHHTDEATGELSL